ncbi:hypothetical protein A4G19_02165 [Pasteurellaceae bacterium Macca]|nr:hypothetical protein [Pasteurellaceae bacterium Macca]
MQYDDEIVPKLRELLNVEPEEIVEEYDDDSYIICVKNKRYLIYDENTSITKATLNAGIYLFKIINDQLKQANSPYYCYSLYADHDFSAIFLTEQQYLSAIEEIILPQYRPYILNETAENYGQHI